MLQHDKNGSLLGVFNSRNYFNFVAEGIIMRTKGINLLALPHLNYKHSSNVKHYKRKTFSGI